jgi:ISPg3, transposase
MSDAEMITILVLFHSTTFRNFKHFYLFYVCREPKEEFPNLLSYTRFVERMPRVADRGIHIVTGIRTNMKNRLMDEYDKIRLRKRSIIETINDMLKNVAQIVHTRHRSVSNFIVNLLAGMAAYAFYDTKPSINMEFEMEGEAEVKQLTLF